MHSSKTLLRRLSSQATITTLIVSGLLLAATGPAMAQSVDYDQTYGGGSYGQADFGGTTAAETTSPTPTLSPSPTPSASPSPADGPDTTGDMPSTGASVGLWAAAGALSLSLGLGLYGYSRGRARRAQSGSSHDSSP